MLLLLQRDGAQPVECLAGKLAVSPRQIRNLVASLEQSGHAHRSRGVVELLRQTDCVFRVNTFSTPAQLNSYRMEIPFRPAETAGGERGGLLTVPESSLAQQKTTVLCARLREEGAETDFREGGTEAQRAEQLARWLVRQIEGLVWSPAYRIGLAVARGEWTAGDVRRVVSVTLAKRGRGELTGPAWQYFVTACKNEISRRGFRWSA